jgi:Bacterial Ig domain
MLTVSVRRALILIAFLMTAAAHGATTFVSPLEGSQAIGPAVLEVTTDAANVDRVEFSVDGVLAGVARTKPYRVAFDFGTSLAARTITAKVWSNGYKTSETATVLTAAMTANDTVTIDLVEVPVRVRSSKTVKAADLRVRENGVEQEIRDVRQERPPAHFAFVVDRSLSMGNGKLEAALRAIRQETRQLRQGDTASVVLFNHHVSKPQTIDSLQRTNPVPSGGTSLRDALASVDTKQRTYAFVITDGGDRNSQLTDEQALRKISGTRTVVNAIVLGDAHAKFLDRAAKNTGGSVVAASKDSVTRELGKLLTDINSRYLVIYQSAGTKRGWRTLDVTPRRRGVEIAAARKGYFAE